jgi:hypothetical protein
MGVPAGALPPSSPPLLSPTPPGRGADARLGDGLAAQARSPSGGSASRESHGGGLRRILSGLFKRKGAAADGASTPPY